MIQHWVLTDSGNYFKRLICELLHILWHCIDISELKMAVSGYFVEGCHVVDILYRMEVINYRNWKFTAFVTLKSADEFDKAAECVTKRGKISAICFPLKCSFAKNWPTCSLTVNIVVCIYLFIVYLFVSLIICFFVIINIMFVYNSVKAVRDVKGHFHWYGNGACSG